MGGTVKKIFRLVILITVFQISVINICKAEVVDYSPPRIYSNSIINFNIIGGVGFSWGGSDKQGIRQFQT